MTLTPMQTILARAAPRVAGMLLCLALADGVQAHEGHANHPAAGPQARSEHDYPLPAVKVLRADGKRLALGEAIDDGRPVMLNFIYTSCTAICPVTSQVFVEVRERLGAERDKINMVSISIDPEQDTPAKLTEYANRYASAGVWSHYTSSSADAIEIQRAFGAWRGDKMNHQPTTYLRAAPGKPWVRLDGFYGPTALLAEFQKTVHAQGPDACGDAARNLKSPTPSVGTPAGITTITTKCKS